MKRIQLFEFEDFPWLPNAVRDSMTRMLTLLHEWLGTKQHLAELLTAVAKQTGRNQFLDYCSGDGGARPDVLRILHDKHNLPASLVSTDLYSNKHAASRIAEIGDPRLTYCLDPIDATKTLPGYNGSIRTMVCSFHHMPVGLAKAIPERAADSGDPIVIYELSDNSVPPKYLWWIGLLQRNVLEAYWFECLESSTLRRGEFAAPCAIPVRLYRRTLAYCQMTSKIFPQAFAAYL